MKIRVLGFATVGDLLDADAPEIALADGSRLSELRAELTGRHPELAAMWPRLAVAVDGDLVQEDVALTDGCEVALLPPVSGGSGARPETADLAVELVEEPIDVAAVERRVADDGYGAVVLFLGTVRNHHRGRSVERLTYTAYRPLALKALGRIVRELEATHDLRVSVVHRLGEVPVGEPSVVIAAASAHRREAYAASRTALERLKREVPIWKREHYAGGDVAWREEEPLVPGSPESVSIHGP